MESAIEQCTSEKHTQDQWDLILHICENYAGKEPKSCLKLINKRVFHKNPNVSLRAITLLDACSKNCGKVFNRELASRDFSQLVKSKFAILQQIPSTKLAEVFQKWAEDFKSDSELALAAELYVWVKSEHPGVILRVQEDRKKTKVGSSRKAAANLQAKEEEELANAIALSLKETEGKKPSDSADAAASHPPTDSRLPTGTSGGGTKKNQLYPEFHLDSKSSTTKNKGCVRALYDFEAVEDNELTFKTGELIVLIDDSDENWWRGSNHRGEGLFPAQFVQPEDSEQPKSEANTQQQQPEVVQTPVRLDETKLDECIRLLSLVDPTGEFHPDPPEMNQLESDCNAMAPLIDPELEKVDRRVMDLGEVNQRLIDAFQMYHELMSQAPPPQSTTYYGGPGAANSYMPYAPTQQQMFYGVNQQYGGYSTGEQPVYTQPSGIHYPHVLGTTAYYSSDHQQQQPQSNVPAYIPQPHGPSVTSYAPPSAIPDVSYPYTAYAANTNPDQSAAAAVGIVSQQQHPPPAANQQYYGYGPGPDADPHVPPNFAQSSVASTDNEARS